MSPFVELAMAAESEIPLSPYGRASADGEAMAIATVEHIRAGGAGPDFLMHAQGIVMVQGEATLRGFLRGVGYALRAAQ